MPKELTPEEKAANEAKIAAEKAAAEKAAAEAASIASEKIKELADHMASSSKGRFDSDYYGFAIENFAAKNLKNLPIIISTGNISVETADGEDTRVEILMTPTCGPFSDCDYYRTSLEDNVWNTPGGVSVTFDNMPKGIREFIKQKREEKIDVLAVKLAELDNYGRKKRSTIALEEEYRKRKENPASGNIRVGCQIYDKNRKLFTYLGKLELIAIEKYSLTIPRTKNSMEIDAFYLVA